MRPFLKWAGNKYKLVERIKMVLPAGERLIEPFAGSGALFLNTDFDAYLLADANADLIHLFRHIQCEGPEFIDFCRSYFTPTNNQPAVYYALRQLFNDTTDVRLRSALFLYLNRHGYNGLCRYNSRGKFNVPFGRYRRPYFPAREMADFEQRARRAEFVHAPFARVMDTARPGDVVYCDPPYVPLSDTALFTSYSTGKFGRAEQILLARQAEQLAARGVPVVISNHHTDFTRTTYRQAELTTFDVRRHISCNQAGRGLVTEVLALFTEAGQLENIPQ